MLRIVIIDPVGQKAGLDFYDVSLAKALLYHSCTVKVYSNFVDTLNNSIVQKHFKFTFQNNLINSINLIYKYFSALIKSKNFNANIIIVHLFHSSLLDLFFLRLIKLFKFRVCIILHDVESLIHKNGKSKISKCVALANYLVVHTTLIYDELITKIGNDFVDKIHIIPHGNYLGLQLKSDRQTTAANLQLDPSKTNILIFGMIKKSKGLEIVIEAMNSVPGEVDLIIAGRLRDVDFMNYKLLIDKLNLSQRIHCIVRYISNSERNMLFNFADLVVVPYRKIYQSGVMLLAMSYSVPVIASDLPANKIIIGENENGLLFKDGNSLDLADKIKSILSDNNKRRTIAENALQYVSTKHDWNKIGDEFYKILN